MAIGGTNRHWKRHVMNAMVDPTLTFLLEVAVVASLLTVFRSDYRPGQLLINLLIAAFVCGPMQWLKRRPAVK